MARLWSVHTTSSRIKATYVPTQIKLRRFLSMAVNSQSIQLRAALITSEPAHDFEAACTSKFSYSSEILQVHEALSEKGGNDRLKVRAAR